MNGQGTIIQSVDRALRILEIFNGPIVEVGITEIASYMELSKSTVHGLVQTLLSAGYLEQNSENKKYRLGIKLFLLGCLVQNRMDLREIAKPYLKQLSEIFDMTVHMGIYQDHQMIYIDKVDGKNTRIIYSQVGKNAPMHCTGIGKAVLAALPEKEQQYLLSKPREALTSHTIVGEEALKKELAIIMENGFAVDQEEVELGLCCVAVPILNYHKMPVGAVSISGPAPTFAQEQITRIAQELKNAADQISGRLGYLGGR